MTTTPHKGTALITGASAGIGAVYADRLSKAGYDLILVARSGDRLADLARQLTTASGRSVETLPADLTHASDIARVEQVLKIDRSITLLVNNAGIAATAPLLQSNVDEMERMITLNVTALTRLAYAAAPAFVTRGVGTIVNIASIVALNTRLVNGVYSATKAYVLALSESLKHELADKGVRIQAVLPGATATDLWVKAGRPVEELPKEIVMTSEDMVDAALAGLDQGEFVTIPSLPDKADWDAFEKARDALSPNLSLAKPAARYRVAA
ncbi:MAG: SDR family NAD(P)-dependent oxidoreductase [Pseudomonadota bacterium]